MNIKPRRDVFPSSVRMPITANCAVIKSSKRIPMTVSATDNVTNPYTDIPISLESLRYLILTFLVSKAINSPKISSKPL